MLWDILIFIHLWKISSDPIKIEMEAILFVALKVLKDVIWKTRYQCQPINQQTYGDNFHWNYFFTKEIAPAKRVYYPV